MIIDALISYLLALPKMLLNSLSPIGNLIIPDGAFDWWYEVFDTLTYIFPIWAVLPIILSSFMIKWFQIGYSLLLRLKCIFIGS